jgi:RND family efflux transporter MFP subunit
MEQWADLLTLVTAFQSCRETNAVLKTLASHVAAALKARASLVWRLDRDGEGLFCAASWFEPGWRAELVRGAVTECMLNEVLEAPRARHFSSAELDSEILVHLSDNDRQRVRTALYAPLSTSRGPAGVAEVLNKDRGDFTPDDAAFLEEACRLAGRQLGSLEAMEEERQANLAAVQRLTDLYDISRVFASTLEMSELLPIVGEKIRDILEAETCNLWLVDSDANDLHLVHQSGNDRSTPGGARIPIGEGIQGTVAQRGEPRLIENAEEEPELEERRGTNPDLSLRTLMCAPLAMGQDVMGVVEVVNKRDGNPFDEDDLFFLSSVSEQAAIALKNAKLLDAERRAHDLQALLATSKELTSTLDLDHVLTTVVHQASTVLPFDLSAIGIYDRNQLVLGAVSGESEVPKTPTMATLRSIMEWAAEQEGAVTADQREEGWELDPEEGSLELRPFMEEHGYRGFYAIPLRDDQGTVGVLALLSSEADFLSPSHLEVLSILTSQTTVAIRNARLYQQVPLVTFWQPLMKRKERLMEVSTGRWRQWAWKAGLVVLALIVLPWKLRVQTNATVVPADRRVVSAEVDGVIKQVEVREGQRVSAGSVLAALDDSDNRVRLGKALTDLEIANRQLAEAEARHDWAAASQARLAMDLHQVEAKLYREKVEKARLVASITGVVVTPKVEEKVGQLLKVGEVFCELVDQDRMAVEMNVAETEVSKIQAGAKVALKLNAFPTATIVGEVERVSPQTVAAEGEQFFVTRAVFPNPDRVVRPGMVGQAKITSRGGWFQSGWYPIGYVVLRSPTRWVWRKAWSLLP